MYSRIANYYILINYRYFNDGTEQQNKNVLLWKIYSLIQKWPDFSCLMSVMLNNLTWFLLYYNKYYIIFSLIQGLKSMWIHTLVLLMFILQMKLERDLFNFSTRFFSAMNWTCLWNNSSLSAQHASIEYRLLVHGVRYIFIDSHTIVSNHTTCFP